MPVINNKLGKFAGPSASYTGYMLIAGSLIGLAYSLISITLLVPGLFMAFTYDGILIDIENRKVKPYTALFGIISSGKWIDATSFERFNILKSTKKYTSYSRANVRFDYGITDVELVLMNNKGRKKVTLNKYKSFEEAREGMAAVIDLLPPSE